MNSKIHQALLGTIGNVLPISYQPLGCVGKRFRAYCAKHIAKSMGENCNIEKGCTIGRNVAIGDNSGIGVNCLVQGSTIIGDNVIMGPECMIYTVNHSFNKETLKYEGETDRSPVRIGNNVWIGARCILLPGITIGDGATVGAGAIVTRDIPAYTLAAGNPAKVIKSLVLN